MNTSSKRIGHRADVTRSIPAGWSWIDAFDGGVDADFERAALEQLEQHYRPELDDWAAAN
jgi:hypothetical protein